MQLRVLNGSLALVIAVTGLTVGCVRQSDFAASSTSLQERRPPFHGDPRTEVSPTGDVSFSDLDSGTPIAVHLQTPLSSALARTGDSFKAILDEPIVLSGRTIARKGTRLTGKVLQAKPTDPVREAGYLRLTLTAITLDGKSWPLQTSHVFVKGATYPREVLHPPVQLAGASRSLIAASATGPRTMAVHEDAGVPAERLLIFRLAQAVPSENAGGK